MNKPSELRIFISSTFRDLQEEREHLVKKIFPEIRALCRERGITFTEIDLRWGLTEEEVKLGQVIRACLEEVDKCRPYFIGITGSRYGYLPSYLDIQKDPALLEQYPWIEDAALEGMSITEMEAHYGVLASAMEGKREELEKARFYFRRQRESFDDDSDQNDELQKLWEYQQRIEKSGASVEFFDDSDRLGKMIYADLTEIITRDFADAKPPTPLEEERARHQAFSLSRRRAYIANPTYLKQLNDHAKGDDPPLIVYAESGSGKSSLFAFWAEQYRRKNPDTHIIEHYVGIGATATDHYAVIRHLCMEIKEVYGRQEEIPETPEELERAFGHWLGYADHALSRQPGSSLVIILDGLNQLGETTNSLKWIPDTISPRIRLILSSTVERTLLELRKRGWIEFGIQALSEPEREAVIVRYLAEFRKSLNPEQITQIASDYKCSHPLFLKTLLEEIRLVNRHEDLNEQIKYYLDATGTEDLFQKVLKRIEEDHDSQTVGDLLSALWCSRSGLDEAELAELTSSSRLKITAMVSGLDYHLVRKDGYLTFFHDYLRQAVEKRYLGNREIRRDMHIRLAEYFTDEELNKRNAWERLWGYAEGGDDAKVVETLVNLQVLQVLSVGNDIYDVLSQWTRLQKGGYDPEELYVASIENGASNSLASVTQVGVILEHLSHWLGAISVYRHVLSRALDERDDLEAAKALRSLGNLLRLRGARSEAMEHLSDALNRYEKLGDQRGKAYTLGNIGTLHHVSGDFNRALESHRHKLVICEELEDRKGMAIAIASIGYIHHARGEHDLALKSHQQSMTIYEELGDRKGIATTAGNMGRAYAQRGEFDRALELLQHCVAVSEELGNRKVMASSIGNMGIIYHDRGEFDRALESYQRQLTVYEKLEDRRGMNATLGNMGAIYSDRGEDELALKLFQQKLSISKELGDREDIAMAIGSVGLCYSSLGDYDRALQNLTQALSECHALGLRGLLPYWWGGIGQLLLSLVEKNDEMPTYLGRHIPDCAPENWREVTLQYVRKQAEESVAIARELSDHYWLFAGEIAIVRVNAAEGNLKAVEEQLNRLLHVKTTEEQEAALHYWLWKLLPEGKSEHRAKAERLYSDLYTRTPMIEYNRRIQELRDESGEQKDG